MQKKEKQSSISLYLVSLIFAPRSEVSRLEQVVEDLKSQLRVHDSIPTHDGGLGGGDFVFSASVQNTLQAAIDKLTKYLAPVFFVSLRSNRAVIVMIVGVCVVCVCCVPLSIIHYTQKTVMTAHPTRTEVKCVSLFVCVRSLFVRVFVVHVCVHETEKEGVGTV